ncbi:hypothetical protein EYF80_045962 [Liparis tanakae]|uniref:Uncharacterized protein n=1 Tax=Liparis tanakae TaxID=230148 RepID=A0A4Z2FRT7_9TELE|nr:hypothetical protein EYF80_045962 [Liparis tanakae]
MYPQLTSYTPVSGCPLISGQERHAGPTGSSGQEGPAGHRGRLKLNSRAPPPSISEVERAGGVQPEVVHPRVAERRARVRHPQPRQVVAVHPERGEAQQPGRHHQEAACSRHAPQGDVRPAPDPDAGEHDAGAAQEQGGEDQTLSQADPRVAAVQTRHGPALLQLRVLHLQAAFPKAVGAQQDQRLRRAGPDPRALTFPPRSEERPRGRRAQTGPPLPPLGGDGGSEDEDQSQRGKDDARHHGGGGVHPKGGDSGSGSTGTIKT